MIPSLHDDILKGADSIAEFVFGNRKERRKIYHLVATNQLPYFKLGDTICARRSTIVEHIAAQERAGAAMQRSA